MVISIVLVFVFFILLLWRT